LRIRLWLLSRLPPPARARRRRRRASGAESTARLDCRWALDCRWVALRKTWGEVLDQLKRAGEIPPHFAYLRLLGDGRHCTCTLTFFDCGRISFGSRVAETRRRGHSATKHQLNLDPNPEGTQKTLDARRYGGREEQRIPRVRGNAGAAQGVPGYLRALGDRTGRTVANGGASATSTDPGET
jgi:hypothetical protein